MPEKVKLGLPKIYDALTPFYPKNLAVSQSSSKLGRVIEKRFGLKYLHSFFDNTPKNDQLTLNGARY